MRTTSGFPNSDNSDTSGLVVDQISYANSAKLSDNYMRALCTDQFRVVQTDETGKSTLVLFLLLLLLLLLLLRQLLLQLSLALFLVPFLASLLALRHVSLLVLVLLQLHRLLLFLKYQLLNFFESIKLVVSLLCVLLQDFQTVITVIHQV